MLLMAEYNICQRLMMGLRHLSEEILLRSDKFKFWAHRLGYVFFSQNLYHWKYHFLSWKVGFF